MTRVSKIIQLVMWSLVALLLTVFLCRQISGGVSRFGWNWRVPIGGPQTVDYTGTFPLDSVKKVEIQGLGMDVDFTASDSDEIQVTGRTGGAAGNGTVDVVNSNGVLQITQKAGDSATRLFGIFNTGYRLQVALPAAYAGDISLDSTSGDVSFAAAGTRGTVAVRDISGDVTGNVAANAVTCRLTSGDIHLKQLAVHSYALETVSGDISCAGVTGAGSLSSVSGDIQADIAALSGASSAVSRSGDIHLQLASAVQARVAAHSVSGDVSSDIPLPGADAPALEASSTSGDVTVRRSR